MEVADQPPNRGLPQDSLLVAVELWDTAVSLGVKSSGAKVLLLDAPNTEGVLTVEALESEVEAGAETEPSGRLPKMGLKFWRGLLSVAVEEELVVTLKMGLKPDAKRGVVAQMAAAAGGAAAAGVATGVADTALEAGGEVTGDEAATVTAPTADTEFTAMVLFILRHSSSRLVGAGVVLGKVLLPVLAELFGALLELTDGGGLQEAGPGSGAAVSRIFWILFRAVIFSSSRSFTEILYPSSGGGGRERWSSLDTSWIFRFLFPPLSADIVAGSFGA